MHIFKKRDDSELYHMLAEILQGQKEILDFLKAERVNQHEELARLVEARLKQLKPPRKTD